MVGGGGDGAEQWKASAAVTLMRARLFVCTTCDRYAAYVASPTQGERLLAAVVAEAERQGAAAIVSAVPCVNSCPHPAGAAVREGPGGGMFRFARLTPADAAALVEFARQRASGEAVEVPAGLAPRTACSIMPGA